jgi:hypothetical protein
LFVTLLELGLQEAKAAGQLHDGAVALVKHRQEPDRIHALTLSNLVRLAAQSGRDPRQAA